MNTSTIRLGGVPEHFNLPIHLAIEDGSFAKRSLQIEWTSFKGGTGQMTRALRNSDVDVCILLTEGIIKDIIAGNPSKIISGYVKTPLTWGIHTGVENTLQYHKEIYDKQYAISRLGSGSHLMAIIDADVNGQKLNAEQFTVINNLDGALESLGNRETDVFYWEKFTTKPWVDSGQLRRVGVFVTPWPCFMVAATDRILREDPNGIIRMLNAIHESCRRFMQDEDNIDLVASRYGQKKKDVERWYHSTEWYTHGWVSNKMFRGVVHNLRLAEIISEDVRVPDLVWKR